MSELGSITWRKGNGNEITTNDRKETVEHCESLKWERVGESAEPALIIESEPIPEPSEAEPQALVAEDTNAPDFAGATDPESTPKAEQSESQTVGV